MIKFSLCRIWKKKKNLDKPYSFCPSPTNIHSFQPLSTFWPTAIGFCSHQSKTTCSQKVSLELGNFSSSGFHLIFVWFTSLIIWHSWPFPLLNLSFLASWIFTLLTLLLWCELLLPTISSFVHSLSERKCTSKLPLALFCLSTLRGPSLCSNGLDNHLHANISIYLPKLYYLQRSISYHSGSSHTSSPTYPHFPPSAPIIFPFLLFQSHYPWVNPGISLGFPCSLRGC